MSAILLRAMVNSLLENMLLVQTGVLPLRSARTLQRSHEITMATMDEEGLARD